MLVSMVLAAQQCAEAEAEAAEPPDNMLSYGLTHLWTSPILRYQLMKQGHASLQVHATPCDDLHRAMCTARHVHCTACAPRVMCACALHAQFTPTCTELSVHCSCSRRRCSSGT